MPNRKSRINHKLLLYAQTQSYSRFRATVIAIAVAGLTAVTVPAFVLVQPTFAREAILMVQRSLQGGNNQKSDGKLNKLIRQIANLEVEKAMLKAKFDSDNPEILAITNEITTFQARLRDVQSLGNGSILTSAITDALLEQIVNLEIERSRLEINHYPQGEVVKFTDAQIRSLRRRIVEIEPQNPKNKINGTIKNALETKISQINAKRAQFARAYTLDDIEEIFNLDLQLRSLEQRLAVYNSYG